MASTWLVVAVAVCAVLAPRADAVVVAGVTLPTIAADSLYAQQESKNLVVSVPSVATNSYWQGTVEITSSPNGTIFFAPGPNQPFTPSLTLEFKGIRDSLIFRVKPLKETTASVVYTVKDSNGATKGTDGSTKLTAKSQKGLCDYFNGVNSDPLYKSTVLDPTVATAASGELKGPYDAVIFSGGTTYCSHRPKEFKIAGNN